MFCYFNSDPLHLSCHMGDLLSISPSPPLSFSGRLLMELGDSEYASRLFKKAGVALNLDLGAPRIEKKSIEQYIDSWNSEASGNREKGGGGMAEIKDYFLFLIDQERGARIKMSHQKYKLSSFLGGW